MCNDTVTEHQVVSYATIVPWELPYRLLVLLLLLLLFKNYYFWIKEKKIVKENREFFEIFIGPKLPYFKQKNFALSSQQLVIDP
jgi:hypothetical protein